MIFPFSSLKNSEFIFDYLHGRYFKMILLSISVNSIVLRISMIYISNMLRLVQLQ